MSWEVHNEEMYNLELEFSKSLSSIADDCQRRLSTTSTKSSVKIKLYDVDGKSVEELKPLNAEQPAAVKKNSSLFTRIWNHVVNIFDLKLLKDPIYLNIMLGLSLAMFAEMNFSALTPFIIADYDLSTQQIATFMSTVSSMDICSRFLAPYVERCLKLSHRVFFLLSLILLITARFALLVSSDYYFLLVVAGGIGLAKGFRILFSALVIPSHVPIERLPSAIGIQMAVNGILVWIGGPVIGFIRDVTGSYVDSICFINGATFVAILMWSVEMLYTKYKTRK